MVCDKQAMGWKEMTDIHCMIQQHLKHDKQIQIVMSDSNSFIYALVTLITYV